MSSDPVPDVSCVTCRANRGEIPAPGGVIHEDGLWRLEHTFEPIAMVGWLVLKPTRHIERVADLTPEEALRLGPLLRLASQAMMDVLQPTKVYVSIYSESVAHVHVHLIPRRPGIPSDRMGPWVFRYLEDAHREGRNMGDIEEAARVAIAIRERLDVLKALEA